MKTALVFVPGSRHSCKDQLERANGVFTSHEWRHEVVELEGRRLPAAELRRTIAFWGAAGCIDFCGEHAYPLPLEAFGDVPVVHVDRNPRGFWGRANHSCVMHDSIPAGQLAARELLRAGVRTFGYVDYYRQTFWSDDRFNGFRRTLDLAHRKCHRFEAQGMGTQRQRQLERWLETLERPAGVYAVTDFVALEILSAAVRLGLRVPDELAVIGTDNDLLTCENSKPTLTSIQPDFAGAGTIAASLLIELQANPSMPPQCRTFGNHYLVRRQSTRREALGDALVARAVEWMRLHACEGVGVDQVAQFVGLSRRSLELRFRNTIGHSPLDEMRTVRLNRAFELLRNPLQEIGPVANLCGYDSNLTLRRMFAAETGMTPRQWRKKNLFTYAKRTI